MAATARDIMERIARSVHATEALSPFASFGATTLDGGREVDDRDGHHSWVRVTGGVDGSGHYPGLWCQFDPTGNTLTDQAQAILVREVMGGALKQTNTSGATVYYWGRMEGDFSTTAVFAVKSESSTSTPVTGTTDYGTSGAAGTSPPGVLSPPTLTVAGPPSWTPAANTYPLEWDKFSGTLYIWNGTTWTEIGCGCTGIAFSVKGNPTSSTASTTDIQPSSLLIPGFLVFDPSGGQVAWKQVAGGSGIVYCDAGDILSAPTLPAVVGGTGVDSSAAGKGALLVANGGAAFGVFPAGANGKIIYYDSTQTLGLRADNPPSGTLSGMTTNVLQKATSSTTIGDSNVSDNGTNVDITATTTVKSTFIVKADGTDTTLTVQDTLFQVNMSAGATTMIKANATGVGFLGATPAAQQTGGSATAGGTYTATEATMLQKAYDALRTFGFLS